MAVFTTTAAAIGTAIGLSGAALTVFTSVTALALSIGASSLIARRLTPGAPESNAGGRVQLPPATDNKLPVLYGSAFLSGAITDAKISQDNKTMWYVVALAEHTDSTAGSGYTYDLNNIYYDGKKVSFGTNGTVDALINSSTTPEEIDTKVAGKINIWLFTNGSSSGVNTGGQTAIQLLQDPLIPAANRWTATDTMTNSAFAVVKVQYDTDAGTTNLGALLCKMTNSINKPGDVIKDYLVNERYGCAIPLSRIDTDSLDELNDYSDELIDFINAQGNPSQRARYRINGPVDTNNNCLTNLQTMVDATDSWLQYSELSAKWKVVINRSYEDFTTIDDLFLIDDNNLVGGINISPINLSESFNELEVSYPNSDIRDQTDFKIIKLSDFQPGVMSPNEAVNRLNISFPLVNTPVQSIYLGTRRLLQSREDVTVSLQLDYSGIQVEAGDVVRIKHNEYGWDNLNDGKGKLFRVAQVSEEKRPDGSLGVSMSAFEYNDTVFEDFAIQDFVLADNLGIGDPNIITSPAAPVATLKKDGTITFIELSANVPDLGLVRYLDFAYGGDGNSANHTYYQTVSNANGAPLVNSDSANSVFTTYTIDVTDVPQGNVFWSVIAKNDTVGIRSAATAQSIEWPGPSVTEFDPGTGEGGIGGNNIQANTITGNNIQANTITIENISSTVSGIDQIVKQYETNLAQQGVNSVIAIDTLGTDLANINFKFPALIDTTSNGLGGSFPWAQGTANSAIGYVENSTGFFEPPNARFLSIDNGEFDWYVCAHDVLPANITPGNTFIIKLDSIAVADQPMIVQLVPFYQVAGLPTTNIQAPTDQMETFQLFSNEPRSISVSLSVSSTVSSFTAGGVLMRIFTNALNGTMIYHSLALTLSRKPGGLGFG